jgi:hypothetical protein
MPEPHAPPIRPRFRPLTILVIATLAFSTAFEAAAHSWYPYFCCSDQDCMKVDTIEYVSGGMYMTVGPIRVFVPETMEKRPSQDGDAHVCVMRTQSGFYRVRCVFLPGNA